MNELGARRIGSSVGPTPPPNLQAGGCRFGHQAEHSVLDPDCRAHTVDNLFVSDGSFMPTGGSVPYTWSIYANALRVADAVAKVYGDTSIQDLIDGSQSPAQEVTPSPSLSVATPSSTVPSQSLSMVSHSSGAPS